jgi:hypothetical protein
MKPFSGGVGLAISAQHNAVRHWVAMVSQVPGCRAADLSEIPSECPSGDRIGGSDKAKDHRSCNGLVPRIDRGDRSMKYLLTGVAVVAALAFSTPGWTQANPSGGNAVGLPGPNPGGPGLTPYTSGPQRPAPPSAPYTPTATPPAMTPSAPPPSGYSSATPPKHRPYRHYTHKTTGHYKKGGKYQLTGTSANQLNQEELTRLQAGNYANPPAPSYTPPPGPGTMPPPKQY